ncbi:MAG TPA: gamma-glutamyl-gamma-aminobutyrate hydrolase family protein [Candidatus Nanoarchaeia archaeon]|nr:gamma-glutamyl-gamma-aminobutyrate hydrolase family protein [Candidatus Nanoarchaeia archaeon]
MLCTISIRQEKNKHGDVIGVLEQAYLHYFETFGLKLLLIPNGGDVDYYFKHFPIERVILSGGNDVDPLLYGGKRSENSSIAPERDATEKRMIELALEKKIPLLGICRGMQFLNVYFGGKLVVLKDVLGEGAHPSGKDHSLNIVTDQDVLGSKVMVNSFHNQGLTQKELSPQLRMFAVSDEGIVEGFYHPSLPLVGIQWHPERRSPDMVFNEKLVRMFVQGEGWWKK